MHRVTDFHSSPMHVMQQTPWKIVHNASGFLTFLGAYSCVMGPLAGVLMSDYYLIRHGRLDVHALYREGDIYWYSYGINWRAFAALLLGLVPLMPGLAHSIAPTRVNIGGAWKVASVQELSAGGRFSNRGGRRSIRFRGLLGLSSRRLVTGSSVSTCRRHGKV